MNSKIPALIVSLGLFIVFLALRLLIPSLRGKTDPPSSFSDRFECGFESFTKSRLMFSFKFYLVLLIFLVFDVEVVVTLPLGLVRGIIGSSSSQILVVLLLFTLLAGLLLE